LQQRLDVRIGGFFVFGEEKTFERFDWLTVDEVLRRVQVEVNDSLPDKESSGGTR
jgi:hypothetical protein